jgi:hypothetical protein
MGGVEHLAKAIGKSPRYVYARLKLLELSAPVQKAVESGAIEPSHAQELVPLTPERQTEMLERIEEQKEYGGMSVTELREEIKANYSPRAAAPALSAKEKARRAKEEERRKKADAHWKRQQAKSEADRKRRKLVNERAIAALWPKMKAAGAKDRDWFLGAALHEAASSSGSLREAMDVAEGKPQREDHRYGQRSAELKRFEKYPRNQHLPLVLLAAVIDHSEYGKDPSIEKIFRWAKIDRKAIERELVKQEKSDAKADAARMKAAQAKKPASKKVPTSAKPKKKARTHKSKKK